MLKISTLVSLLLLAVPKAVYADPCVSFDADFNLLAFGINGKDYNAGKQDSWSGGSPTEITTSGRPPFDGTGTTCYLAQFFNAVYVLNGDKANPSDVHIYDAGAKTWSTQKTNAGKFDLSSFVAILDHDTNVFYAVSQNELFFLNMGELKAAQSDPLDWTDVQQTPYGADYQPVAALAQNHIHFINVPGTDAGSANIFVIHFSFFQPQTQAYPGVNGGKTFPAQHGQTASFFQSSGVQQEFAFIPDDGSQVYVVNVENNSTTTLPGPSIHDPKSHFTAGISSLIQLDSTGVVSYIPYSQGDLTANAQARWSSVEPLASLIGSPGHNESASSTATGSSGSVAGGSSGAASGGATATGGSAIGSSPTGATGDNGSMGNVVSFGTLAGALLAVLAFLH